MTFAALQERVNAAVLKRLSDRAGTFVAQGGGVPVPLKGIYHAAYAEDLEGLAAGSTPAWIVDSTALPPDPGRGTVALEATAIHPAEIFEVARPERDGSGFTVLRLRKVA